MVAPVATGERQEAGMSADRGEDHRAAVVEETFIASHSLTMIVPARMPGEAVMVEEDLIEGGLTMIVPAMRRGEAVMLEEDLIEGVPGEEAEVMPETLLDLRFGYPVNPFSLAILLLLIQVMKDKISPVHRPDKGGTLSVRDSKLRVNHFPLTFKPDTIIMHYNVDVKPMSPARPGRPQRISKSDLSMIRETLFSGDTRLPLEKTVYDGEKNILSAVRLPEETFTVTISAGEDERSYSYQVTLTLVNELEYRKLSKYLNKELMSIPRDILQGMDIVFKENPAKRTISLGRSFYPSNPPLLHEDLHHGIIAIGGFQHSLKPTSQGLSLCLDYSVLSFRKRMSVLDFLCERISNFRLEEFGRFRNRVTTELIGLKVNVTHRRTRQKFTIVGLSPRNTRDTTFPLKDPEGRNDPQQVTILDYFWDKYNKDIAFRDIPCLDFGKGVYVPMEFCILVEGQRYPKEYLDRNASKKLKGMSLADPKDRQSVIQRMVESSDGPCGGGVIQNFGMEVNTTMTSVLGRIIEPPRLKVGGRNGQIMTVKLDTERCHWNLVGRSVMKGKPVERWGIIDFTSFESDFRFKLRCKEFIPKLKEKFRSLGIGMSDPLWVERSSMNQLESHGSLSALLKKVSDWGYVQFILCVMSQKHFGYKMLKWISETKVGVVTQCCLSGTVNTGNDQNFTNLALKINAKLGGSNVELENRLPCFAGDGHVMFIGADVNHPAARDVNSLSIAAVVGTVNWPAANRYAARVSPQSHRKEQILNFGTICLELVNCYAKLNTVRPEKIVVFRDGVSEGQFDMVLNEELQDLKRVFRSAEYFPTITLIVAQKRHQTRLFREEPSVGNVYPGTVVDTTVVHPFEFDFYLCSHYGSLGTSKPTHYHVLWDEHRFTSDALQKLIYDMCFTFARCTKPVSLVPPVYYADLVAYRGRLYYEAKTELESSKPASIPPSSANEQRYFKLHGHLEDMMFFV
ncbi:protein argonaute 2-like isoform X2 [Prosopis cineraria]|uniref:protein argonaute 2-like isoform X2 n=1 Tax=Prosopis cineraria TaxID=364024 RepID=UPI00240F4399|nr:protein argonaute 2-like isoform X2 [Prosopis cineraria]